MIRSATGSEKSIARASFDREGAASCASRALIAAAILVTPIAAHAQPTAADRTQAEALFNEGKKLQKEGKIAEACRKFEGSYKIDPAGGTVLNLGLCHEKEGKIASAWGELKEALAAAKKANRKDREKIARERIDAIEPRLPFMIVIPDKPFDGLAITVDGAAITSEAWGAQLPIDPGSHAVKASGPKHDAWEGSFEAAEGKKVTVRVPALAKAVEPVPTATATAAPVVLVPKYSWMRPSGIAIGSVGVAAVVVGAVFGASALSSAAKAKGECDANLACTQTGFDAVQSGRSSAFAADLLLGAGAGFAALGAVFFFLGGATTPATQDATTGARIIPTARISTSGGTLGLEGAW